MHHNMKHGAKGSHEYKVWDGMKQRCFNPKCDCYPDYGGRGITVCDRWKNSFVDFITDVGLPPTSKHQIDRIDNDGNYEPENCRWATSKEQHRNRRDNLNISAFGETKCLSAWAEDPRCVPNLATLAWRICRAKWSVERALTAPTKLIADNSPRLTPEQKLEIAQAAGSQSEIGRRFGIAQSRVSQIKREVLR